MSHLPRQQLAETASWLKRYLLQEHPSEGWISTDRDTFLFFRHLPPLRPQPKAAGKTPKPSLPSPPKVAPPRPVVKAPAPSSSAAVPAEPAVETKPVTPPLWSSSQKAVAPLGDPFEEVRRFMAPVQEQVRLVAEPPDDTLAQKIAHQWQYRLKNLEAVVLCLGEEGESRRFLQHVARAIDLYLMPCRLIPYEKWTEGEELPKLKWILASEQALKRHPKLGARIDFQAKPKPLLEDKSLLLLGDISAYLNTPSLKATLWETLVKNLSK